MDQGQLSSRAIIGAYFARLEQNPGLAWVNGVSNLFTSDQASEDYNFLGFSPGFREWIGGRQPKGLRGNNYVIANKHYEASLEVAKKDVRRDKTAQIMARVEEFADGALSHWAELLTDAIVAGESAVCYDGQYFFDTDHSEGASGSQSNDITVDISALPAAQHGSVTNPSKEEMQQAIIAGIAKILSFKNDQGKPMNESANAFLVMVPIGLFIPALAAVSTILNAAADNNMNPASLTQVQVVMNPRLTWTDAFSVWRTDAPIKAMIRQTEQDVELKSKAEGTDFEFDHDAWQFGLDSWRNVGYGYWQRACFVRMV